ncbi:cytochrome b/b6 domain-containing protein [Candidatus Endoriftia persephone]|jgi:cytochrome b|uniref:Cytochrome B561 n=3 Tax=Gammaproteobacteria TaxID=1236 RepID=G2FDE2_9GAMM|nr:cytochrome b/b6 domain-containing protein [Candidatus Endoriftia persephone]EGW55228.1 cytochrome B561 [endosymbiont of Tevnia jerichonana (vent Tica)]USF88684.1 cytochrome b/b6 domain-containing protein [Candidatus Endoriftia persephone]
MTTEHSEKQIKVWDPLVRLFHWSLAVSFLLAYLSEDDFTSLHIIAGYSVGGLVVFRLLWGFIGPRHARFSDFAYPPTRVISYLKRVIHFRAERYLGHNPAGGAMVMALLLSLFITVLTGLATYGAEQSAGPLAPLMISMPFFVGKAAEEVHEFFANFTLLLVALHIVGVLLASVQHNENLVRAMFSGRKRLID